MKSFLNFLQTTKSYIGFSDWTIGIESLTSTQDSIASVNVDIYEKTVTIKLSDEFMELKATRQCNVLFHELVHGRMRVVHIKIEEFRAIEEEHLVNDIVRGFEEVRGIR